MRKCETPKKCEHEWYASQWSKCSSDCGSGVQTRKVFCGAIDDEGTVKKVEDTKCDAALKYEAEKNCTGEEECKGDWFSGPWSPVSRHDIRLRLDPTETHAPLLEFQCSKPCGGGQKARKVLCLQNNETVAITNCDGNSVPFSSEVCNNHACGEDEVSAVSVSHDLSEDDEEDCEDYDSEEVDETSKDDVTLPIGSSTEAVGIND